MSRYNSTIAKYRKVEKTKEKAADNEIRIRAESPIGKYISYAATLLLEKKVDSVILKGSGNATKSACQIAEILRHKLLGLHQLNILKTISVTDEYEPKEEGLDRVVVERKLAVLEIHLSIKEGVFDTKAAGYQAPLPKEEVQEEELKGLVERRTRGGPFHGGERRGGDRGGRGRGERGGRGFRRGRFAGPRGGRRGGYRGDRDEFRERRDDHGDDHRERRDDHRERRDDRDRGYGGDRREGGYGGDRREGGDNRRGGYGGERREGGDNRRGGYRGDRGGERRGGYRGDRGGDREKKL
jgi:DNA-binding protein